MKKKKNLQTKQKVYNVLNTIHIVSLFNIVFTRSLSFFAYI